MSLKKKALARSRHFQVLLPCSLEVKFGPRIFGDDSTNFFIIIFYFFIFSENSIFILL